MSQAAWCNINDKETNAPNQIGHAFNGDDEDREHFTKTRTVNVPTGNSYGRTTYQERQEITETLDMCGYHARIQAGTFGKSEPDAITVSAQDIQEAEDESDAADAAMWKARYEAERACNQNLEHAIYESTKKLGKFFENPGPRIADRDFPMVD